MTMSHLVSGAINWDKTIFVQKFPKIGEEVQVERVIDFPGGKGANVAVSSARILGRDKVVLFGALGSDLLAKEHLEILRKDGIITDLIQFTRETSSGQAYIIVDSYGRNSIMTFKKANDILTDRMAETKTVLSTIRSSSLVTVIDPPLAVAKKLIFQSAGSQKITVWAPGMLSSIGVKNVIDIIRHIDFLVVNSYESSLLSGNSDPVAACRMLATKNKNMRVIITRGKKGCIFGENDCITSVPTVNVAERGFKAANTVGAGDAFIGAFCAMKILGKENLESLFLANMAGSIKITKKETRGSPTIHELTEFSGSIKVKCKKLE
jgi:ribokinase